MIFEINVGISNVCCNYKDVIAAYLYGSVLRTDFKPDTSDMDVLIIINDQTDVQLMTEIKTNLSEKFENLDLSLIYEYEYLQRLHPGWSRHYFYNVKHSGIFIYGKDILRMFDDLEINFDEAFKRLIFLTQRIRFVVLNRSKKGECKFWLKKYRSWIPLCLMEFLTLNGVPEFKVKNAHDVFNRRFTLPFSVPSYPYVRISELHEYLEYLCLWVKKNEHLFNFRTSVLK